MKVSDGLEWLPSQALNIVNEGANLLDNVQVPHGILAWNCLPELGEFI